jgi:hypothetical protein
MFMSSSNKEKVISTQLILNSKGFARLESSDLCSYCKMRIYCTQGFRRLCSRGSRFLSYNFLQFVIDGKNNSTTKVEKGFFFIFMSSYAKTRFFRDFPKKLCSLALTFERS